MHCNQFQQQLDDYLDGSLPAAQADAIRQHLAQCAACHGTYHQALLLQATLRQLAPPPASANFYPQVLQRVTGRASRPGQNWLKGALAASVLMVMLLSGYVLQQAPHTSETGPAAVTIALLPEQSQTVQLAFNSNKALTGVALTLSLPEHVEIAGFPGQRQLSWTTDLAQGPNVLRLPLVIGRDVSPGAELVAQLHHASGNKTFRIQTRVAQTPSPHST